MDDRPEHSHEDHSPEREAIEAMEKMQAGYAQLDADMAASAEVIAVIGAKTRRMQDPDLMPFDPTTMGRFDLALERSSRVLDEVGYPTGDLYLEVARLGGLKAARQVLASKGKSDSLARLAKAGKLSASVEYQVLRPEFRDLFSDDERGIARRRLIDHGLPESDLP